LPPFSSSHSLNQVISSKFFFFFSLPLTIFTFLSVIEFCHTLKLTQEICFSPFLPLRNTLTCFGYGIIEHLLLSINFSVLHMWVSFMQWSLDFMKKVLE
jgi:hypothetical protein